MMSASTRIPWLHIIDVILLAASGGDGLAERVVGGKQPRALHEALAVLLAQPRRTRARRATSSAPIVLRAAETPTVLISRKPPSCTTTISSTNSARMRVCSRWNVMRALRRHDARAQRDVAQAALRARQFVVNTVALRRTRRRIQSTGWPDRISRDARLRLPFALFCEDCGEVDART